MSEIKWEDPPPAMRLGRAMVDHGIVVARLRERPGSWGVVGAYSSAGSAVSTAYQIRGGTLVAYRPKGTFEASARTVDGEHRIYARYVGDAS